MNHPLTTEEIQEDLAQWLDSTGEYRVLRKLKPPKTVPLVDSPGFGTALFIDTETTGLDPERDEIIELAMVPLSYSGAGNVVALGQAWEGLRQPSLPISPAVTAVHGITDAMVDGRVIDPEEVARFIAPFELIVGHNAAFDRGFLERFCGDFAGKAFGCSMTEVDWRAEGHEGLKLGHLAADHGFFYDRHRAVNDCHAGVELLSRPLLKSGVPALAKLLERAREPSWRIWATGAPFETKDALKVRGYRWHDGGRNRKRAWYIDVAAAGRADEIAFLEREIFRRPIDPEQRRLDAYARYSVRAFA